MRAEKAKKDRQQSEKRKYEAQKREAEALNRERLRGLRVVQKNLVYVTGLNPRIREEDLLQTLRGVQYFGQYGKIIKIVVNKRTTAQDGQGGSGTQGPQGLGVYVTFARKEDAHTCIAAVDGSQNGDRTLRYALCTRLPDFLLMRGPEPPMGLQNTVLPTFVVKLVQIRTACFYTNREKRRNRLTARDSPNIIPGCIRPPPVDLRPSNNPPLQQGRRLTKLTRRLHTSTVLK